MAEEQTNENPMQTPAASESEAPAAPGAGATPAPAGGAAPAEPAQSVAPKERRRRPSVAKSATGSARAARTPEERQQERAAERGRKAATRRVWRQSEREKAKANRTAPEAIPPREHEPGKQKIRQGIVVSNRADKTITVRIDVARRHRRYAKVVRTSSTLHVHDERNDAHIGDTVIVRESRPLSRTKHWRLVEVVERAK
jgi:small subunit ribosomal protein S17